MTITPHLFEAFLKCKTKCWLRSSNAPATGNAYAEWFRAKSNSYRIENANRMLKTMLETERAVSPDMTKLKTASWRLATSILVRTSDETLLETGTVADRGGKTSYHLPTNNSKLTDQRLPIPTVTNDKTQKQMTGESCLHAVQRIPSEGRGKPTQFIPFRFIFTNKLGKDDKLLLAFDALILSQVLGREVRLGKIVHGDDHAMITVKTSAMLGEVRKHLDTITTLLGSLTPPDLVLNPHCADCEFQGRCREIAMEKDDLSLLAGMTDKHRKKFHSKGIFTVTQLSYTFRPRRRPKRLRNKRDKYYHSLKALAIREKKIHIVGRPELKIEGTPVYLDVEGLPDRDFYYLIGVRVGGGEFVVQHHLWADATEDEERGWRELLAILESAENPVLVYYGSFEKTFWKRMCERYGEPSEGSRAAKAMSSGINLVQLFFAQIYFPTYSNRLKEIAAWCGFSWSDSSLSGASSIVCRSEWEASGIQLSKQRLITYNADDCKALEILMCFASGICQDESPGIVRPSKDVISVEQLKPLKRFNLINKDGAALPEFKEINKAAYWDYQRQRVYVRSSKVIKKDSQRKLKGRARRLPVQSTIEYPRPSLCPGCGGVDLQLKGKTVLRTYDVKFMRSGVKGLVRRQIWPRYHCASCKQLVRPDGTRFFTIRKYGLRLRAYAITQLLELRISGIKVARSLNHIFNFDLTGSLVSTFKSDFANMYDATVKGLINRIATGSLVHADETQATVVGKSGYVWVLSSLEEVVYIYNESRDGDMIRSFLANFHGVLVSDFYSVYDAIDCPQQKCLIHLIRDINDDLHKHPFDEDLRKIAQAFAGLLAPMIKTIDKRGLKKRFLSRYLVPIEKYYSWLAQARFASDVALGYQRRFSKYRDKLFTFVTHDDVPWNNNNAENAIRAFGEVRDIIKGVTTEKGLREYLILLSLCETCKRRGINFIDFLCSGEVDFERFTETKLMSPGKIARHPAREAVVSLPQTPAQNATPPTPESPTGPLPSNDGQCHAQNEKELLERELDAWSRFSCPGRFPWPEIVDPIVRLERYDGVPIGGALAALPALVESGFAPGDQLFPITIERRVQEIAMALISLASVSQTLSIEALQLLAPPGWRKFLCAQRLPDNKTLTELIKLICSAPVNIVRWNANCASRFVAKMSGFDALLSVDSCRHIYANRKRVDSSSESARRMLLARCMVASWAHSLEARPFLFVGGTISRENCAWLSQRFFSRSQSELFELRKGGTQPMLSGKHPLTVILGAGGLFPEFFASLLRMGHHVLSYLPSSEPPWPDAEFTSQDVKLINGQLIRLQFAERALPLDGAGLRELRCRRTDGRQIVVICSNPELDLKVLAGNILAEFNAACFLGYLGMHSALDGLCEGIVDPAEARAKAGRNAVTADSFRPFGTRHSVRDFVNAIKLVSFRAENMMEQIIREHVSQPDKATLVLQDLLSSPADLVPDLRHQTLTIRLHPQVRDGYEEPLRHLCSELTLTETIFPASDLRLVYAVGRAV